MSVILNPEIAEIEKESLLFILYTQLYQAFFDAQDKKSKDHPFGIVEGDESSIRLKNTAYTFALAINMSAGSGEGGTNPEMLKGYLKKTGGTMTGELVANHGFKAGINNSEVVDISQRTINDLLVSILSVTGKLEIESDGLLVDGFNVLNYSNSTLTLNGKKIVIPAELTIGDAVNGLTVSKDSFKYKGKAVYHGGNSNSKDHNWSMKDATVDGKISIKGLASINGGASVNGALAVIEGDIEYFSVKKGELNLSGWANITEGLKIKDQIIIQSTASDISLGIDKGAVVLGTDTTKGIFLNSSLMDYNGAHVIIDKFGSATFHNGLSAKHDFGETLMQTYRVSDKDEGVIFYKNIRLGTQSGVSISATDSKLLIGHPIKGASPVSTSMFAGVSESYHSPKDKVSYAAFINTDASLFVLGKPLEAKEYIGIDKSSTRLTLNSLFFKDNSQLISVADGIKHYGNSYLLGSVSSERFASGFSGYGWAILNNQTTGSYNATFDELTIRKKMRVYELEVQKTSATNGSLWVSDACSGDTVQKLN